MKQFFMSTIASQEVDENTVFLPHFDGEDEATSAIDSALGGNAPHTITFHGDAELDTAIKKYGASSLKLGGTGYVTIPDTADVNLGTDDFTLEGWFQWLGSPAESGMWSTYSTAGGDGWQTKWEPGNGFRLWNDGSYRATFSWSPSANTMYHVAFVRASGVFKFFVDGSAQGSPVTVSTNLNNDGNAFAIGSGASNTTNNLFVGNIDENRISHVARYSGNFTPSGPFTPYL